LQKAFDKKLNYTQQVLNLLEAGDLEPSDLPGTGFPGSDKYLFLFPRRFAELVAEDSDFEVLSGSQIENFEPQAELPNGWSRFDQNFKENTETAHGGAFRSDGLPAGEDLEDLPYSWDFLFSQFDKDMWKKFNPIK
jgi:hypothetical protein